MADASRTTPVRPMHETAEVDASRIWRVATALVVTLVAVALLAAWVLRLLHHQTGRPLAILDSAPGRMPVPSLQSAPALDLAAFRAQKQAMLGEYRWLDREHGILRIPIERAIELLATRQGTRSP